VVIATRNTKHISEFITAPERERDLAVIEAFPPATLPEPPIQTGENAQEEARRILSSPGEAALNGPY
jgi:hypothetical protein